jgi:hypothetical protein
MTLLLLHFVVSHFLHSELVIDVTVPFLYCFRLVIYVSAILISFCTYAVLAGPYIYGFL